MLRHVKFTCLHFKLVIMIFRKRDFPKLEKRWRSKSTAMIILSARHELERFYEAVHQWALLGSRLCAELPYLYMMIADRTVAPDLMTSRAKRAGGEATQLVGRSACGLGSLVFPQAGFLADGVAFQAARRPSEGGQGSGRMKPFMMIQSTPAFQMAQFTMNSAKAITQAMGAKNLGTTARASKPIAMTVAHV